MGGGPGVAGKGAHWVLKELLHFRKRLTDLVYSWWVDVNLDTVPDIAKSYNVASKMRPLPPWANIGVQSLGVILELPSHHADSQNPDERGHQPRKVEVRFSCDFAPNVYLVAVRRCAQRSSLPPYLVLKRLINNILTF